LIVLKKISQTIPCRIVSLIFLIPFLIVLLCLATVFTNISSLDQTCETVSGDSDTGFCIPTEQMLSDPIMSGSESPAFVAPLHQMRVSQIPLRPSEHTAVNIDARNVFSSTSNGDPMEMQSSLDHARYNIVGKYSPS
jgi:hypothetical protein